MYAASYTDESRGACPVMFERVSLVSPIHVSLSSYLYMSFMEACDHNSSHEVGLLHSHARV